VVAQLRRPAIAEDFLINCVPFLSNFVKTLNTLNNLKLEQDTVRLQGGVRDQIGAVELTGWSTFEHGGRAADGIGAWRRTDVGQGVGVGACLVSGMPEDGRAVAGRRTGEAPEAGQRAREEAGAWRRLWVGGERQTPLRSE
jgi:hypothetical protein